jgi:hypothetical protein
LRLWCCVSVGADNVDSSKLVVEVLNETLGTVRLRWEEPPSPNGIIVTYQIEYKSIENPNVSLVLVTCSCDSAVRRMGSLGPILRISFFFHA